MDVWLAFAYISEGEIKNVACYLYTGYTEANAHARTLCEDETAFAVEVTHIPVQIGDIYEDGVFYRPIDGGRIQIDPLPTVADQVAEHSEAIDDLIIAITPTEAN